MKKLGYDPFTGITDYFYTDSETGKNIIKSVQDVNPILEANMRAQGQLDRTKNRWYVGTIPQIKVLEWSQQCGHPPYSRGWHDYAVKQLNKAENRKLNPNKIKL